MKFVLTAIDAKYIHTGLAVYSLKSYAGKELQGHIELAEYTINQRMEQILADLYRRKPDVIGFSCYIWNFSLVKRLIREFSKLLPDVPVWLGGPEVSYEYQNIFEDIPEVTGVMVGEGEETFRELLMAYVEAERKAEDTEEERAVRAVRNAEEGAAENSGEVEDKKGAAKAGEAAGRQKNLRVLSLKIPGTATREGFFGARNALDMDSLPFYYEELGEDEREQGRHKIIYYESGRGCPFRCSYCLSSIEKQVRLRDAALVEKELLYFLDRKVKQVKFIDRTFNCDREHALSIWRFLSENDNGVTNFHFEIAAELLTREELEVFSKMRRGLIQLEIGVQTTNRETLRAIHRPGDLEKCKRTVRAISETGNIHQHLDLIAGLPFEDLKSFRNSFNEVFAMAPHQIQLGFLKVLKGSEIYERAEEYGIVCQSEPPYEMLYTKWLSYEDVLELKRVEEMVELFYNSSQFCHTMSALLTLFESPYDMFLALAEYYEKRGFPVNSPSRNHRYEIVLEFVKSLKVGERAEELFGELLTFDVYLREKAKSRPAFSRDIRSFTQKIILFYRQQEKGSDLLPDYVEKGYDGRQMMRMTHVDVFRYPVWDKEWLDGLRMDEIYPGQERFILFDYEKRNPLTYEAEFMLIEI